MNLGLRRFEIVVILSLFSAIAVLVFAIWAASSQIGSTVIPHLLPLPVMNASKEVDEVIVLKTLTPSSDHSAMSPEVEAKTLSSLSASGTRSVLSPEELKKTLESLTSPTQQ